MSFSRIISREALTMNQGKGKNWLNRLKTAGTVIIEKTKLERTNWFDIDLLPPARAVSIGVAVTGGTAACKMNIRAMS